MTPIETIMSITKRKRKKFGRLNSILKITGVQLN